MFNGKAFVHCRSSERNGQQGCDCEETEESDVQLEYDPVAVQESVQLYLDSEFNDNHYGSLTFEPSFGFQTGLPAENESNEDIQREFEQIRHASQKLLVETGAPSSSLSADEGRTGMKRKLDEHDDFDSNTHHLTIEDIYKQTKSPSSVSSSSSPVCKTSGGKAQVLQLESNPKTFRKGSDDTPTSTATTVNVLTCGLQKNELCFNRSLPRVYDKLTRLRQCTEENSLQNILFVVLQVNDTREIQVKSGMNAGSFVSLSSIVVADDSKPCFRLTLWREASNWIQKITPGDFAVATCIKIGKWRDEFVGQTTINSRFCNFHQPKTMLSHECLQIVSQSRLDTLVTWVKTEHPYLLVASQAKTVIQFTDIGQLRDNTLAHFRGKLLSIHRSPQTSSTYQFGGQRLNRITAVLAERQHEKINLYLWGRQTAWINQLQEGLGHVWEFQFLTVKYNSDLGCVCLHTTPKSTRTRLFPEDTKAMTILARFNNSEGHQTNKFSTLGDLLAAKYNGMAEVKANIFSLRFQCDRESITVGIHNKGQVAQLLQDKVHKLVYVGCGSCSRALTQDQNKVYGQCSHCVVNNPGYNYTIDYFFKPLTICLRDSQGCIEVEASSNSVSRLFDFPAKTLAGHTAQASCDQSKLCDFFERVNSIIDKREPESFIITCRTTFDENSFVEERTFTILKIE